MQELKGACMILLSLQGFKIIFEFSDNSYFSNKELVKTYYMVSDDAEDPVLQRAIGTTIQWASGKNPGVKVSQNHLHTGRHVCGSCSEMTVQSQLACSA